MPAFDHHLADKGFLRASLLTGLVLLSTTVASSESFSDFTVPIWGLHPNQVVASNGSTTTPTVDLLYRGLQPSNFTVLDHSQLPPQDSLELRPNGVFSVTNVYNNSATYAGPPATVWVQKGSSQSGVFIIDDNSNNDDSLAYAVDADGDPHIRPPFTSLDVALYHVPDLSVENQNCSIFQNGKGPVSLRSGIHVHVDQSSSQKNGGSLYGLDIGAHADNSVGAGILATGSGAVGILSIEGDSNGSETTLKATSHQIVHYTGAAFSTSTIR